MPDYNMEPERENKSLLVGSNSSEGLWEISP